MDFYIKDKTLAKKDSLNTEWASQSMSARKRKTLKEVLIAVCLNVTTKIASLIRTLKVGGAETILCAPSSPHYHSFCCY